MHHHHHRLAAWFASRSLPHSYNSHKTRWVLRSCVCSAAFLVSADSEQTSDFGHKLAWTRHRLRFSWDLRTAQSSLAFHRADSYTVHICTLLDRLFNADRSFHLPPVFAAYRCAQVSPTKTTRSCSWITARRRAWTDCRSHSFGFTHRSFYRTWRFRSTARRFRSAHHLDSRFHLGYPPTCQARRIRFCMTRVAQVFYIAIST